MSRGLWWRFLAISVAFALLLSLVYALVLREINREGRSAIQRSLILFAARALELEAGPYPEAMRRLDHLLAESPVMPRGLWVIDLQGRVLASRSALPLPPEWRQVDAAMAVHDVRSTPGRRLQGGSPVSVTRLQGAGPVFLVMSDSGIPGRPVLRTHGLFFIAALAAAVFFGLSLVTLYLRARSREARQVLARLKAGDLGARFRPGRLDAVGVLMLDFNRMAEEIERLVHGLHQAEDARRAMLQELGHDLRTPLTSLRTAVEAVSAHGAAMTPEDRHEFLAIIRGELDYFVRLIDDLFFIADIGEVGRRPAGEPVDLVELLVAETRSAQSRASELGVEGLAIGLTAAPAGRAPVVAGDRVLLSRLFRNAIDNALRHARSRVQVKVRDAGDKLEVRVEDDGRGMSTAEIAAFGQRRGRRRQADAARPSLSLGLGSVIMKSVVEIHGGQLGIESGAAQGGPPGTRLVIRLPRGGAATEPA
ncbi:HAMP domain-containing histidine kinase [Aquabacterium sp. A7-Y]|uniref:sensor histidine kinase n=1 Tax=Aquabacterium sp. A7-Y TaxID=1349605 RepID=UPI00223D2E3A|nr:HAMP domain-containing sensor histidine kinase [Aquabacterium sp. A7-Y]MCW7539191.1 HAMP domain-containing histidine kinase [Aquabacterium sp. A7-Y]